MIYHKILKHEAGSCGDGRAACQDCRREHLLVLTRVTQDVRTRGGGQARKDFNEPTSSKSFYAKRSKSACMVSCAERRAQGSVPSQGSGMLEY